MKKTVSSVLVGIILITVVLGIWQCSSEQNQQEQIVKMIYPPIVASLPMFIAEDRGLAKANNIEISAISFTSSNDMVNALISGQVDLLPAVSLIPIIHLEIQYPGKVRLFSHSRMRPTNAFDGIIVKENAKIENLKDLEGKKVGGFPGTSAKNMFMAFLQKHGINDQIVSFVQLAPSAQLSSLESGAIDALFSYEPVTTIALKKGGYRSLYGSVYADLLNPCPIGASVIRRDFEKKNRELAEKSIEVIDQGVIYMREKPNEAKQLLPQYIKVQPDIASLVNVVDVTLSNENDLKNLQDFIDLLYEIGEIPEKIDASRLVSPTE